MVVEDVAVLKNFHVRRPFVRSGFPQRIFQMLLKYVHGTRDESRVGPERQRNRIKWAVGCAKWSRFRFLSDFRCGRVLPLRQAVDAVVEHQYFQSDIAAQHVNRMIAANRKRISVAGRNPYLKVGSRDFEPRRDRWGAAVNRMKAERVHVVREAARAADPRNHDEFFFWNAQFGENGLNRRENRVIAAAGTPADFLVGLKIFLGVWRRQSNGAHFS